MIHPSYTELLSSVNADAEDTPVVNSRYSIVMATAKRARQIIAGEANVTEKESKKPLSTAVSELYRGKVRILPEAEEELVPTEAEIAADPVMDEAENAVEDAGEETTEEVTEEQE